MSRRKRSEQPVQHWVVVVCEPNRKGLYLSDFGTTDQLRKASRFEREEAENLVADNRSAHPECEFKIVRPLA